MPTDKLIPKERQGPFNLVRFQAGDAACTRDGQLIKYGCYFPKAGELYRLVALIGNDASPSHFKEDGRFEGTRDHPNDLFMVLPEPNVEVFGGKVALWRDGVFMGGFSSDPNVVAIVDLPAWNKDGPIETVQKPAELSEVVRLLSSVFIGGISLLGGSPLNEWTPHAIAQRVDENLKPFRGPVQPSPTDSGALSDVQLVDQVDRLIMANRKNIGTVPNLADQLRQLISPSKPMLTVESLRDELRELFPVGDSCDDDFFLHAAQRAIDLCTGCKCGELTSAQIELIASKLGDHIGYVNWQNLQEDDRERLREAVRIARSETSGGAK